MEIGFISIFLSKARVLNLTISKRKNLRLPLKVEPDQFVFVWFYQSVFLSKFVAFHPRTVKRIVKAPGL